MSARPQAAVGPKGLKHGLARLVTQQGAAVQVAGVFGIASTPEVAGCVYTPRHHSPSKLVTEHACIAWVPVQGRRQLSIYDSQLSLMYG